MATIPDCTLTTGCFLLTKYNPKSRSLEETLKGLEGVLSVRCYLVIYCNETLAEYIIEKRKKNMLEELTRVHVVDVEELWTYQYADKIKKNHQEYWPTRDERISVESMVVVFNKFDFLLETIEKNPFQTTKFGWIDGNLGENGAKICLDGDFQMHLLYTLYHLTDKFHLSILNVEDKKYKEDQYKREYYEKARWVASGCLFTTSADIGRKILKRLKEVVTHTIDLGYGHGDEYFFLDILEEFYDDIYRGYGDYKDTLFNFIKPTKNLIYIYWSSVMGNYNRGYYRECIDACRSLISSLDESIAESNFDLYVRLYSAMYLSLNALQSKETSDVANIIKKYYKTHPMFRHHFDNLRYYTKMTDFKID
jgi:hypothetical protein